MAAAPETPQVIEAACLPLRQDRLDKLLEQLEMCEKALQVRPRLGMGASTPLISTADRHAP